MVYTETVTHCYLQEVWGDSSETSDWEVPRHRGEGGRGKCWVQRSPAGRVYTDSTLRSKYQATLFTVPTSEVSHTLSEGISGTRHDPLPLLGRGLHGKLLNTSADGEGGDEWSGNLAKVSRELKSRMARPPSSGFHELHLPTSSLP